MSANPRVTLVKVTYAWGEPGCTVTLPARTIIDCPAGSTLEQAIGAQNLGTLSPRQLSGAANFEAGTTN